ncbi:DNA-binding CsgD family transcriptional regulator [Streptomyces sp. LBL]|uniref:helix-turn-helix transcriptional regulator n=1 Tax=Streptomyces sp. LBL TaxID=2940562 RepID=UPI002475B55A|nr:LuxR C-terminal-related transcriptional regulator [Streptomyces sp. LBL]MDH6624739.1 DNA-binding CsgD family transcriptional regulator [Streptomyces sp. LBL]
MARARAVVRGRDQELAVLREAAAADGGRLIVLKGPAGIGRTALLDVAERILRAAGMPVLPVRLGAGPDSLGDDAFGLAPLVRAVRDQFEQFQETGLADSLGVVARLSDAAGQNTGGWAPSMVTALGNLFDGIGRQGRTAILTDDVHAVAEPAPTLTAARRSGCLVLATCEESAEHAPGLAELLAAADQVVTLGPLADDIAESLARRAQGARLDEGVPDILRTALGPLFGNPGTVLGTLADLRRRGRLTVFRGRLCLRSPSEAIELAADHHLLRRVASFGDLAAELLSSIAVWDGFSVADLPLLAEAIGADLTDCGRLLDQLIDAEVLVADPAGRVSCRCPALAAAVAGPSGTHRADALHTSIAERLLARHRRRDGFDPVMLADHIARGGTAVVLEAPMVTRLLDLAVDAEADQPDRASLWYVAALRRLPPGEPEHARTLTRLLNLVVRTGRYELLRDVLTQYAEQGCAPSSLAEIRLAAVLFALHSGEPPAEEAVRSLLDEGITGRETIGFALWWFGRPSAPGKVPGACGPMPGARGPVDAVGAREVVRVDSVEAQGLTPIAPVGIQGLVPFAPVGIQGLVPFAPVGIQGLVPIAPVGIQGLVPIAPVGIQRLAPADPVGIQELAPADRMELLSTALSGDPGAYERAWRRSGRAAPSRRPDGQHRAASMVNMATMTQLVLGVRYRAPATGVLGVYRRVVRGYVGADWSQAMSAVRELELSDSEDTLVHHAARLFAADMCAARGESPQAAQWLADVEPVPWLAVMRAWVRIGLFRGTGEGRRAAPLALRVSRQLRRAGLYEGLPFLLKRAVRMAVFVDDQDGAAGLLEEIELLHREAGTDLRESLFLARGLVHRDVRQARLAVHLTRARGDLPALLDSCLVIARFAENPRPWLREAHGLATQCGASLLLERVREVTRERGVPAPRARGQREALAVTERRIIELIGEGLTNRQIALRLQISEKTVENYLTRLFARTGCRSRVELAAASLGGRLTQALT